MPRLAHFVDRLLQKFVLRPIGYGHPVPREALDAEYREGHWDHFNAPSEAPRYDALVGLVGALFPENPAILDVGCGSGQLAERLRLRRFEQYLGVDLSSEGVRLARALQLPRMDFVEGDFETWRPTGTFDVIVFNESAGYARDPARVLAGFSRHLRPGGLIVVSQFRFGNHRAMWRRIERTAEVVRAVAATAGAGGPVWDIRALRYPASARP